MEHPERVDEPTDQDADVATDQGADVATDQDADVQAIKEQIVDLLKQVDVQMQQIAEILDRPLPSQDDQAMGVLVRQDDGSMINQPIEAPIQPKHVSYMQNR